MSRYAVFLAMVMTSPLFQITPTSARWLLRHCLIQVDGREYLNKPCNVDYFDNDEGFIVNTGSHSRYFAYVIMDGAIAEGSWNEGEGSHAQAPLGYLTHRGNCWENARAKICLTKIVRRRG